MVTISKHIIFFVRRFVYITLDTIYILATIDVYETSKKKLLRVTEYFILSQVQLK